MYFQDQKKCREGQFECGSGECIDQGSKCDGSLLIVASNQMKQIVVSWHNGSQLDLQFVHKTSIFMPAASSFEFWFASGPNKIAENVPCSIFGSHLY